MSQEGFLKNEGDNVKKSRLEEIRDAFDRGEIKPGTDTEPSFVVNGYTARMTRFPDGSATLSLEARGVVSQTNFDPDGGVRITELTGVDGEALTEKEDVKIRERRESDAYRIFHSSERGTNAQTS